MAKKGFARRARSFGRKAYRRAYSKKGGVSMMAIVPAAALYGAARGYLSNAVSPLTSKIPLGNYADEALFGVAGYLLAKKTSGMLSQVGKAMLTVEAASVGAQVAGGLMQGSSSSSVTNSGQAW